MKIFKVTGCSTCPHQSWDRGRGARVCKLSNKDIWYNGKGTPVSEFPNWCELDNWPSNNVVEGGQAKKKCVSDCFFDWGQSECKGCQYYTPAT